MITFSKIVIFEVRSRFLNPFILLFLALTIFQGIWYTQGNYEYYVNDSVLMNAASIFYKNLAGMGPLMIIIIAIITVPLLYKDIQYKAAQSIYTLPISEKQFMIGRFLSAYIINVLIGLGFIIGFALVPYSGIGAAEKFGATPWIAIFHGYIALTMTNLFILTGISYAGLVLTKKPAVSYVAIFAILVLFFIAEGLSHNAGESYLVQVLDPFTYVYTADTLDKLPAAEKNVAFLSLGSAYWFNRLIWIGLTCLLLFWAYRRFSFKYFIQSSSASRKPSLNTKESSSLAISENIIPPVHLHFSNFIYLKKCLRLARLEFLNVVRPASFKVILGILSLMFFLQNMLWNATYYLGPQYSVTSSMTFNRLTLGAFLIILLMIWAGELFFKDKTANIWQITDVMPVPIWVSQLAKYIAMAGVALLLALTIIACGIFVQIITGGWKEIDLLLYIDDVLGYKWGWLTYLLYIAFVFMVAGLTGHRFVTHILSVGFFFFIIVSFDMGILEELRFGYGLVPGIEDYSEMNAYGIWSKASFWYFLTWLSLAAVFILLGIYFWRRGTSLRLRQKLSFRDPQLTWPAKGILILCIIGFIFLQSFITNQVNQPGNYTSEEQANEIDAAYEKKYKYLENTLQPKIEGANINLDLYPEKRTCLYQADLEILNPYDQRIDTLYLSISDFVEIQRLQWKQKTAKAAWEDEVLEIIAFPLKLNPGEKGMLSIKGTKTYIGFTQDGESPQPDLTYNGSFMGIRDILPVIGYDADRELLQNRDRSELGLPKLTSRMADLQDQKALSEDIFAPDAYWLKGAITLSTSKEQIAYAPGELTRTWTEKGRSYFSYTLKEPSAFHWYFGSGQYQSLQMTINDVKVQVLHKPSHTYNLQLYQRAIQHSIDFVNQQLDAYPYAELRLVEIPFYQDEQYAFPNTIAISEKEGWIADSTGIPERAYLLFTVSSQIVRHWMYKNLKIANVQGAEMLRQALPEAIALQVVKKELGVQAVEAILQKKKNLYGKERGNEPNIEPPLIYADGIDYLEANKGTLALFRLSEILGNEKFNQTVVKWIEASKGELSTFQSLYKVFLNTLPNEKRESTRQQFEEVQP